MNRNGQGYQINFENKTAQKRNVIIQFVCVCVKRTKLIFPYHPIDERDFVHEVLFE